jgi:hypothetical protein
MADRETGQAQSCVNCFFMCQARRWAAAAQQQAQTAGEDLRASERCLTHAHPATCARRLQDGTTFKAQVKFAPYFLLATKARAGSQRCTRATRAVTFFCTA